MITVSPYLPRIRCPKARKQWLEMMELLAREPWRAEALLKAEIELCRTRFQSSWVMTASSVHEARDIVTHWIVREQVLGEGKTLIGIHPEMRNSWQLYWANLS